MTAAFMTQTAYADHRGVGRSSVSNWKKDGLLVMKDGKVDVIATDRIVDNAIDPMKGRPAGTPTGAGTGEQENTLASERLAEVRESRIGKALKNAQLAGDLAPVEEMQRTLTEAGRMIRDRMQAAFRNKAERLAAETETRTVLTLCSETIDEACASFADAIDAGLLDAEGNA